MEKVVSNLYCMIMSNFGFSGQECGLSLDSSLFLLEFFVFNCDADYSATITLLIYMMEIREEEILKMDKDSLFRYLAHGCFIEDCIHTPDLYKRLV